MCGARPVLSGGRGVGAAYFLELSERKTNSPLLSEQIDWQR